MKLKKEEYELLYKKLEYTFKKSGNPLVDKLKNEQDLSDDDIKLLLKKIEYTFRKSGHKIIDQLSKMIKLDNYSPVTYSNLKAKENRDLREKEKLKHLKSFDDHKK